MQALFKRLEDTGQLQEQTIEQLYSEAAGKFLADRFVTGTCPKCGYEVRATSLHCASLCCLQSLSTGSLSCSSNCCVLPAACLDLPTPSWERLASLKSWQLCLLHAIGGLPESWTSSAALLILTCLGLERRKDEHDSCGALLTACSAVTLPCPQASTHVPAGRPEDEGIRACAYPLPAHT